MEKVFFEPWVGENYETGGVFGKRVMALGESGYCFKECEECGAINRRDECSGITKDVIKAFLDPNSEFEPWMNTFTKFERTFNNKELNYEEKKQFWQSIIFYNYLQTALNGPRIKPDKELYAKSFDPFIEVLELYKPDLIIVWGQQLFNALPEGNGKEGSPLIIEGNLYDKCWIYTLNDAHQVKLYAIDHPSSSFPREYMHLIIKAAIEN
jgi:hypothetical protein